MFNFFKKRKKPESNMDELNSKLVECENRLNEYFKEKNAILEKLKLEPENQALNKHLQLTDEKICQLKKILDKLDTEIRKYECNIY